MNLKSMIKSIPFIYRPTVKLIQKRSIDKRIKALHRYGYDILSDIYKVFENSESKVFCTYGTLLGLVRDGDFIKTDFDMDLGVLDNQKYDWDEIEKKCKSIGLIKKRQFRIDGKIVEQTYCKFGLDIDFFLYSQNKNGYLAYELVRDINEKNTEKFMVKYIEYPSITGLMVKTFNGVSVVIPENVEDVLEAAYGKGWRVYDPNFVSPAILDDSKIAICEKYI